MGKTKIKGYEVTIEPVEHGFLLEERYTRDYSYITNKSIYFDLESLMKNLKEKLSKFSVEES
jgi:lipopolysaccharide/colanic/teichoic acid biosynthesis glycosyltransferase